MYVYVYVCVCVCVCIIYIYIYIYIHTQRIQSGIILEDLVCLFVLEDIFHYVWKRVEFDGVLLVYILLFLEDGQHFGRYLPKHVFGTYLANKWKMAIFHSFWKMDITQHGLEDGTACTKMSNTLERWT